MEQAQADKIVNDLKELELLIEVDEYKVDSVGVDIYVGRTISIFDFESIIPYANERNLMFRIMLDFHGKMVLHIWNKYISDEEIICSFNQNS